MRPSLDSIRPAAEDLHYAIGKCLFGPLLAAFSQRGLVALILREDPADLLPELQHRFPQAQILRGTREDQLMLQSVIQLIKDPALRPDLPLDLRGTPFQRKVWQAIMRVPYGRTATYADIARRIRAPRAMRAVGSSCANCPLPFVIPCHRILKSDGTSSAGWPARIDQLSLIARERA